MAYCNNCGAYIPDGHTVCLACGFDSAKEKTEAAEQTQNTSTASEDSGKYYSFSNEELRRKLDEQRRKQQEQSRKWAEQEKRRRESQKKENGTVSNEETSSKKNTSGKTTAEIDTSKVFSVLSYVSFLFVLPMIFSPNDRKAMFHAKQGLRLFIYSLISDSLSGIPVVGVLLQIGRVYLLVKGIINAINEREEPLPYIGKIGGDN